MDLDLMGLRDVLDLLIGIYEFGWVRILLDLDRIGIELLLLRLLDQGELGGNVM
jgi:hypothetical protein